MQKYRDVIIITNIVENEALNDFFTFLDTPPQNVSVPMWHCEDNPLFFLYIGPRKIELVAPYFQWRLKVFPKRQTLPAYLTKKKFIIYRIKSIRTKNYCIGEADLLRSKIILILLKSVIMSMRIDDKNLETSSLISLSLLRSLRPAILTETIVTLNAFWMPTANFIKSCFFSSSIEIVKIWNYLNGYYICNSAYQVNDR